MMCMCGDFYCRSCGPAQGNHYCDECGKWTDEGGCDNPEKCEAAIIARDQRMAEEEAMYEKEKNAPCYLCGKPTYFGQCDDNACRAAQMEQHWLEQIDDNQWIEREDESGIAFCPHNWNVSIIIDGGDVMADRICKHCQRHESQILCVEPEPPNCYVPGEGWRTM